MPLTLPAGITALRGLSSVRAPLFLVEILWPAPAGTKYFSSGEAVNWNGHDWEANRCMSIPSFEAGYIDRKSKDFTRLEIEFDNLANDGSANFPFTALEAGQNLEDAKVNIYAFSRDANDAVLIWWGHTAGRKFDGRDKKFALSATFFWESFDVQLPSVQIHQKGFSLNEISGKTDDDEESELFIPLVYGLSSIKFKPVVYDHWTDGGVFKVKFIVSGTHAGLPFNVNDIPAAGFKLFGVTPATIIEWYQGNQSSAPSNLSRFSENQVHPLVAFGYAEFPITDALKDKLDDLKPHNIKATLVSGKPLLRTSLPSENPVLILEDLLRDPVFGLGLSGSLFDATALVAAANYVGTRYSTRYEFRKPTAVTTLIQQILGDCHCYITFEGGLIQINAKRNNETSVATFTTCDAGVAPGRKVHDDYVDAEVKDSSELINQVTFKYRTRVRKRRIVTLYDPNAQIRAGGTAKKVVSDDRDEWEQGGLIDETQAQINSAITLREEQNGNLFPSFTSPFWDSFDIKPGEIITIRTVDIFNNASNRDVRVKKKSIDGQSGLITFQIQIYKSAIYNDDATALGIDLLRGGDDTSAQGRPPDVVPVSLQILPSGANDSEGKMVKIRATFTLPAFDPATEQSEGAFREAPIQEVECRYNFDDEVTNQGRYGAHRKVVQTTTAQNLFLDFDVDYKKSRIIIVYFMSIGPNGARAPLGLIPDSTRVTTLTAIMPFPGVTASVASTVGIAVDDFTQIEREINRILSKTSNSLTFYNVAGVRTTFLDTLSAAHPLGMECAVLKASYPNLALSLNAARFEYVTVSGLIARPQGDSVRFKWNDPSADNRENFLFYWSTDADALTNPAKLGSATPAWYLLDPLSPPAGVFLSINDDLQHKVHQADAGGAGVVVKARVAARNGKRNFSSALSASAQGSSSGSTIPDSAPVSSPAVPEVRPGQSAIKIIAPRPSTNFNQFVKLELVVRVVNGSTILGYLQDSTTGPLNAGAGEFKNDEGPDLKNQYNWKKAAIVALFPTATDLKFYYYITNGAGVSSASSITTLNVATWEVDAAPEDGAAPSGTLTAPTVKKLKRHGLKIDLTKPATNNLRLRLSTVYIANGNHSTATLWLGSDLSSSVVAEANGAIQMPPSGGMTIPVERETLEATFGVNATATIYATWTNDQGTSGFSSGATFNVSNGESGAVAQDTATPNNGVTLTAPNVYFEPGKGIVIDFDLTGMSFMNTHLFNTIRIATLSETVPTRTITNAPNTTSPTTITTSVAHGFSLGQIVVISGVLGNTAVNGTWEILTVPTTTTFTIAVAGSGAYTGGGSVSLPGPFLDIPTKTLIASGVTSKKEIGKGSHTTVHITRSKLRKLFGPTAHLAIRYFITNSKGETGSALTDFDLATLSETMTETGLEVDAGIPAKTLALTAINLVTGGGMFASKDAYDGTGGGSVNSLGLEWRDAPNRTTGVRIDTTGTKGLKWIKASHLVEVATNVFSLGGELSTKLPRQIIPGETYALWYLMRTAASVYTLDAFTVSLYDEGNSANIPGTPITFNANALRPVTLTTTYIPIVGIFTVDGAYVPSTSNKRQWLRFKFGANPTQVLHIDKVCLVRNAQVMPWAPSPDDSGVDGDADATGNTGSGAVGSTGGGGNGSGGGFGGYGPGEGGTIIY